MDCAPACESAPESAAGGCCSSLVHNTTTASRPTMLTALTLAGIALLAVDPADADVDASFISRVENTPWLDSGGKPFPRVGRDSQGNVEKLGLSGMQLSAEEFAAIGRIKTLRFLNLHTTNVTDADLRQLR